MATFRRGLHAEDRVCTKLEGFGCRIQRDARLDHKHKLDFVITNYIDNPNFYSLGVQITTKLDVVEKQEEFLRANLSSRVTIKALYIELFDRVDLDDGGALAILAAILEFQFNRSFANVKIAAARIYEDLTYQFYDLGARVKQLHERLDEQQWKHVLSSGQLTTRDKFSPEGFVHSEGGAPGTVVPERVPGALVKGVIDSYVRQGGHGILLGESEDRYFFHISHVEDEGLRDQLNALPISLSPARPATTVEFVTVGYTKSGARYPEARGVRCRS